ncbi:hypothetical protein OH491_10140 [Termitidicoccus mucosus]|uniref:HEAT repeat domain-containing protein n=1 Tax=Termitidicoccus mucosus TaxID=1184151 RepID=A0A178IHB9_9BACT|nr:hypothetical protein AW736_17200 [Opitutaceae bacterium TSB47]
MSSRLSPLLLLLLVLSMPASRSAAAPADTAFAAGIAGFAYGENAGLEATAFDYIAGHHDDPAALRALASAAREAGSRAAKPDGRAVAAWIIGLTGDDSELDFLKQLLRSRENFPDAVSALVQLRTGAAVAALAAACNQETDTTRRLALVSALGQARSPEAAGPLAALARDTAQPRIAAAARAALAASQTSEACAALAALPAAEAASEQVVAARTLAILGQASDAAALAGRLASAATLPVETRVAAARVVCDYDLPGAGELLAALADAKEPALQALAYDYFARLTAALQKKLLAQLQAASATPAAYQRVVTVLPAISATDALPFLSSRNQPIREAAMRRVALEPDRASFDRVLSEYAKAGGDAADEWLAVLVAMPRQTDGWFAAALASAKKADEQIKLCELVKRRAAQSAAPALRPLLAASDAKVRAAAFGAIGAIGFDHAADALALLLSAPPSDRREAVNAVRASYRRSTDRNAFASAVVAALDQAASQPQIRDFLLTFAGESGTPAALFALWKIYDDGDAAGRLSVLRALAKWPDGTPLDRLAEIAADAAAPANLRALALRDYLDILARATGAPVAERLRHAGRALALAQSDQDRLAVLSAASAIPDPKARDIIDAIGKQPELNAEYDAARKAHAALLKNAQPKNAADDDAGAEE